ncbi:Infection Response protein [Physocladia obscura]|uniref:Infection Response protein n=1 Tax=Physocladia obscura TaxID=109957 RepID=A0AAD5SRK7_9FUNG|nr:Infection Response protein [Physocladia obscura]
MAAQLYEAITAMKQQLANANSVPKFVVSGKKPWIDPSGKISYNSYVYAFSGAAQSTLSNWYPCRINIKSHVFSTSETVIFAACKAALFNDAVTLAAVLQDARMSPRDAKAIGRTVSGFDAETWMRESRWISDLVLFIKCIGNEAVLVELMKTRGMDWICEASTHDRVWGVGAGAKNTEICLNPQNWKGANELGHSWIRVRQYLERVLESGDNDNIDEFLVDQDKVNLFFSWFP